MSIYRFFCDEYLNFGDTVSIPDQDYNHLKNSLRIKTGEKIELCDGKGGVYNGFVREMRKDRCIVGIMDQIVTHNEPDVKITLYTAILKGDGFDNLIKKVVECGVFSIVPVITRNTIVEINEKNIQAKMNRWNRIARLACMQSKRDVLVKVTQPVHISEVFRHFELNENDINESISFVCHETEKKDMLKHHVEKAIKEGRKNINLLIGPEGGFESDEIEGFKNKGIMLAGLGKRILRAETAAITAVFYTAYAYEK